MVSVSSITATSISLSWSVASGRIASWEVVWRPTDRGTESTSGSLPGNTYTIHHLDSSTIYTVTVTATNVAGTTDSTPIYFSTGNEVVFSSYFHIAKFLQLLMLYNHTECTSCDRDNIPAIIGGVIVANVFIVTTSLTTLGIVLLVLRSPKGNYSTSAAKQGIFGALYFYTSSCVTVMQFVVQTNHWSSPCSQRHEFV